jgi:hypothetical protein
MGMGQSVHSNEVSAQGSELKQMRVWQEEGRLVKLLTGQMGQAEFTRPYIK